MTHNDFDMDKDVLDICKAFLINNGINFANLDTFKKNFVDFKLKGWETEYRSGLS